MPDFSEDDIRKDGLYDKLVFVIGNARSGTTIVAQILNMSERVFVLEEGNICVTGINPGFPSWFNDKHREEGKPPRKGTYVPFFEGEHETGLRSLRRLAADYDFVGDKVAFNPYEPIDGKSRQQYFFEIHAKYFRRCRYIFTTRNPHESLLSMHRLIPAERLSELLWCWLESLRYLCIAICWFPRWRMLLLEQIGSQPFSAIGSFLGIELTAPDAYFDARLRQTSLSAAYDFGSDHQVEIGIALGAADIIYQEFSRYFSPTTLGYQGNEPIFGLMGALIRRIESVQGDLRPAA